MGNAHRPWPLAAYSLWRAACGLCLATRNRVWFPLVACSLQLIAINSQLRAPRSTRQVHMPGFNRHTKEYARMAIEIFRRIGCIKFTVAIFAAPVFDFGMAHQVVFKTLCNDLTLRQNLHVGR